MRLNVFFFFLYVSEYGHLALRTEMKQTMTSADAESTFKNLYTQWETILMFRFVYISN